MRKSISLLAVFLLTAMLLVGCGSPKKLGSDITAAGNDSAAKTAPQITSADTAVSSTAAETEFPAWFLQDLQIASSVHFPIAAATYALDWNSPDYANHDKSLDLSAVTKQIWFGSLTGNKSEAGYRYYWGQFDLKDFYERAKSSPQSLLPSSLTPIYVLESIGGMGALEPAISVELGDGGFLAFAPNQVITKDIHAGVEQYTVYQVPGIKIPGNT